MPRRHRQFHLSLAAKCELLFGSAVLLVIAASLLVPWQRMEQLMDQKNASQARVIAEWAESQHVSRMRMAGLPVSRPSPGPASSPTSQPAAVAISSTGAVVRMFLAENPGTLQHFETKALKRFRDDPSADDMTKIQGVAEGAAKYRFARPMPAKLECMPCHRGDLPPESLARLENSPLQNPPLLGIITVELPYQEDANQAFLNRIFMFLAGVVACTVAIIAFYVITTGVILKPVRVLQEAADKVSQDNLDIRSHIPTGDEFQHLSETFNKMLQNLQESQSQLRTVNASLDLKLNEMAESNLALYESNRLKSEFLNNVSHELRTPLNSILGFADLLKDNPLAVDPRNARYIQNIISSGKNLLELINDLLDLAKIEAGKMEVRSEKISLSDLFEGLLSILKPLAEKKNLNLEPVVANDVPILETDPAKLQQILYNLLSNAIKFSPNNGTIELAATRADESHVKIVVKDQGPGIEPEKQAMLFEKFRQIDGSHTRQHGGTGLGLAISRELTQLLGGGIGLTSEPGKGTTFWIMLPDRIAAEAKRISLVIKND